MRNKELADERRRAAEGRRKSLGERMRIARKLSGLTLGQAARRLCVDRVRLWNMESQGKPIGHLSLTLAAAVYDVRAPWLRGDSEPVTPDLEMFARRMRRYTNLSQWEAVQTCLAMYGPTHELYQATPSGDSASPEISSSSAEGTPPEMMRGG